MTVQLSVDQVVLVHREQCGGAPLIDQGKLEGALAAPFHTFGGVDLFGSLPEKAAKLIAAVSVAHAFGDGNKRLAWMCGVLFLDLNGLRVDVDQEEAADMVVGATTGDVSHEELALWLNVNSSAN